MEFAEVVRWTELVPDPDPHRSHRARGEERLEPSVRSRCAVGGPTCTSERISVGVPELVHARHVEELDPGDPVAVHHHPLDPARAVLHRELLGGPHFVGLLGAFLLALGCGLLRASARAPRLVLR